MTTIKEIYQGAIPIINKEIEREAINKGHYLTGTANESLGADQRKDGAADVLEGHAIKYFQYINDGTRPEKASMKQWPFVYKYFLARGYSDNEARGFAAATIKKWMKQGMSTKASSRFSQDGTRNHIVRDAFEHDNGRINNYMVSSFNNAFDEKYRKEKSETI